MVNYIKSFFILYFASKGIKNKIRFIFYLVLNLISRLNITNIKGKDFRLIFKDIRLYVGIFSGELGGYIQIVVKNINEKIPDFKPRLGDVIIDIGSNIGLFAIKNASRIGVQGKIWAFEPNPLVFNRLVKNLDENNITNAIPVQKAVTSTTGKIKFVLNLDVSPESRILHPEELDENKSTALEVESITLDDFIQENNIKKINLIKIDVEGEEYEVLKGGSKGALFITEKIVMEYHKKENGDKSIRFLNDKGFSLAWADDKNCVLYFKNSNLSDGKRI